MLVYRLTYPISGTPYRLRAAALRGHGAHDVSVQDDMRCIFFRATSDSDAKWMVHDIQHGRKESWILTQNERKVESYAT